MGDNEVASKLFDDCRGASKAQAVPWIEKAIKDIRDAALEEAATVCEIAPAWCTHCSHMMSGQNLAAWRIRELKKDYRETYRD